MLGLQRGVKRGRSPRTQGHRSHGAEAGSHLRDSHPKADGNLVTVSISNGGRNLFFFSLTKRRPWSGVLAVVSGNLGSRFSSAINWPCDWAGWLLMNASMCIVTLRSKQLWEGRCSANSPGLVPKSSSVPSHDPGLAGSPRPLTALRLPPASFLLKAPQWGEGDILWVLALTLFSLHTLPGGVHLPPTYHATQGPWLPNPRLLPDPFLSAGRTCPTKY